MAEGRKTRNAVLGAGTVKAASASVRLRRSWAAHRLAMDAFRTALAAASLFLSAVFARGFAWGEPLRELIVPALFAAAGAWLAIPAWRDLSRVRLFLRGRGKPSAGLLRTEMDSVRGVGGVFAIFGVIAAIALPAFLRMIPHCTEGATKGNLGAIRSALSIYYGDHEGVYPAAVSEETLVPKYLGYIPNAKPLKSSKSALRRETLWHPESNKVTPGKVPTDEGGWLYNDDPADPNFGTLWVNCTHTDPQGHVWTTY